MVNRLNNAIARTLGLSYFVMAAFDRQSRRDTMVTYDREAWRCIGGLQSMQLPVVSRNMWNIGKQHKQHNLHKLQKPQCRREISFDPCVPCVKSATLRFIPSFCSLASLVKLFRISLFRCVHCERNKWKEDKEEWTSWIIPKTLKTFPSNGPFPGDLWIYRFRTNDDKIYLTIAVARTAWGLQGSQ